MARWDDVDGFCTIGRLQTPSEREIRSIFVRGRWFFEDIRNPCAGKVRESQVFSSKQRAAHKWTVLNEFWEFDNNPGM